MFERHHVHDGGRGSGSILAAGALALGFIGSCKGASMGEPSSGAGTKAGTRQDQREHYACWTQDPAYDRLAKGRVTSCIRGCVQNQEGQGLRAMCVWAMVEDSTRRVQSNHGYSGPAPTMLWTHTDEAGRFVLPLIEVPTRRVMLQASKEGDFQNAQWLEGVAVDRADVVIKMAW